MKLTTVSIKKLNELNVHLDENILEMIIRDNLYEFNSTFSKECLFYKNNNEMRDIINGNLCRFRLSDQLFTHYRLFINGKKIDFIDNVYALEKLVEFSENVVLLKVTSDNKVIPWLLEIE